MNFRLPVAFTVLLCTLAPSVIAQQVRWSFSKGDNTIEASSKGIHINQRRPEGTNAYALARARLGLADAPAWRVTFDVRFGQLRAMGAGVKLGVGDAMIGEVSDGADGICVLLGNDWKKVQQPLDARWHHFVFVSDGTTITVNDDGAEVHHEPVQGTPNTLLLGSWWDGKSKNIPSQQSEVWLRNVRVQRTLMGKDDGAVDSGSHGVVVLPPPISPALYFAGGFDTASLVRETDTPDHPASQTLTEAMLGGETAGALHVRLSDLTDHDTLRAPDFPSSPTTFDGAKTVLWARGDAHTPTLMAEWDERDGTRWIATFPVTDHWQRVVLSPKDFHPWLVDADRARLGFHPTQAMSFRMGLDASNTHTAPGAHEYWVAKIGIESSPIGNDAVDDGRSPRQASQKETKAELAVWFKKFRAVNRENEGFLNAYNQCDKARETGTAGVDQVAAACQALIDSNIKVCRSYQQFDIPASLPEFDKVELRQALQDAVRSYQFGTQASQQYLLLLGALKPYGNRISDIPPSKAADLLPKLKGFLGQALSFDKLAVAALDASSANLDEVIRNWGITNGDVMNASALATPLIQKPPAVTGPNPRADARTAVDELVGNTEQALLARLVDVRTMNLTSVFGTYSILDFAVTNRSKKPIMFWTTPTLVFVDGSEGAVQSGMVNNLPFRSVASQMQQAYALVNSKTAYSGPATPVQGKPVARAEDTLIEPGATLFFHCGTLGGNATSNLVQIKFKGGGWNDTVIDFRAIGTRTSP